MPDIQSLSFPQDSYGKEIQVSENKTSKLEGRKVEHKSPDPEMSNLFAKLTEHKPKRQALADTNINASKMPKLSKAKKGILKKTGAFEQKKLEGGQAKRVSFDLPESSSATLETNKEFKYEEEHEVGPEGSGVSPEPPVDRGDAATELPSQKMSKKERLQNGAEKIGRSIRNIFPSRKKASGKVQAAKTRISDQLAQAGREKLLRGMTTHSKKKMTPEEKQGKRLSFGLKGVEVKDNKFVLNPLEMSAGLGKNKELNTEQFMFVKNQISDEFKTLMGSYSKTTFEKKDEQGGIVKDDDGNIVLESRSSLTYDDSLLRACSLIANLSSHMDDEQKDVIRVLIGSIIKNEENEEELETGFQYDLIFSKGAETIHGNDIVNFALAHAGEGNRFDDFLENLIGRYLPSD